MDETPDAPTHELLEELRSLQNASIWRRFTRGLALPLRSGWLLLKNRQLWPFVIAPAVINLLLFAGALFLLLTNAATIADWIWAAPEVGQWQDWVRRGLWYLLVGIIGILSVGASYIFVLLVGGIVASPFNDKLSERVEAVLLPSGPPTRNDSLFWGALRAIGSSIFILGSYVVVMAPIVLLNLVPLAGPIAATILGSVVSALFLAVEYTDAPVDRRGNDLRTKFELIENNRSVALGFGLGASLLLWIPLLNFMTIPLAVSGGTALGIVLQEWER